MKPLTVVAPPILEPFLEKTLLSLVSSDLIERIVVVSHEPVHLKMENCDVLLGSLPSRKTLSLILDFHCSR